MGSLLCLATLTGLLSFAKLTIPQESVFCFVLQCFIALYVTFKRCYLCFFLRSLLESGETVCPMCSQTMAATDVKLVKDPSQYLKTADKD